MRKSKLKEQEHKPENTEDLWEKAFDEMCKSLDKYGCDEILHILIANSHKDIVVHHLLLTYPRVVAGAGFLSGFRYNIKVSKRLFQKLKRERCIL